MSITVHRPGETPSEQIVAAASGTETVTDGTGRALTVRKLTPFDRMRMSKVVGAENSANQSYMVYALVAYSLKEINGEPVVPPRTKGELEHLVQRLGEEGYQAALDAVVGFYGSPNESGEFLAEAKKSPTRSRSARGCAWSSRVCRSTWRSRWTTLSGSPGLWPSASARAASSAGAGVSGKSVSSMHR